MTDEFDPEFDTALDSGGGDPDRRSARLHQAHRLLWSRPLPSGAAFALEDARPGGYLVHESDLGTFHLASDSIIHTYRRNALTPFLELLDPGELERFVRVAYMVGGYIVWPVGTGRTINQVRGFDRKSSIDDRFDLTLECIRLHYEGIQNPLSDPLAREEPFFSLFRDFSEYAEHFLLQDLVSADGKSIRFFLDGGFSRQPLPQSVAEYREYSLRASEFVLARNERMRTIASGLIGGRK